MLLNAHLDEINTHVQVLKSTSEIKFPIIVICFIPNCKKKKTYLLIIFRNAIICEAELVYLPDDGDPRTYIWEYCTYGTVLSKKKKK